MPLFARKQASRPLADALAIVEGVNSPQRHRWATTPTSPINKRKSSSENLLRANQLLNPANWTADKYVGLKADDGYKHGLQLHTTQHGVVVQSLDRAGNGCRNGVLAGDVILAIDGCPISSHLEAQKKLDAIDKCESSRLTLTVSGDTLALTLDKSSGEDVGLSCTMPSDSARGVLIADVQLGSLAYKMALKHGDRIISVNEQLATSHEEAVERMNAARGEVRLVVVCASGSPHRLAHQHLTPDPKFITATFQAGPLGMTLRRDTDDAVKVTGVDAASQAEQQGVLPGSVVLEVLGTSVQGLDYATILSMMKRAARPMHVLFIHSGAPTSNSAAAAI